MGTCWMEWDRVVLSCTRHGPGGGVLQEGHAAALWVLSSDPQRLVDGEFSQPALPDPWVCPPRRPWPRQLHPPELGPQARWKAAPSAPFLQGSERPDLARHARWVLWLPTPRRAEVSVAGAAGGALWTPLPDGDDPGTSLPMTAAPCPLTLADPNENGVPMTWAALIV